MFNKLIILVKGSFNKIESNKRLFATIIFFLLAVIITIIYLLFFHTQICDTKECFISAYTYCKRVSYFNEDDKTLWYYSILGNSVKDTCKVDITLVRLKQGTIELEKLEGLSMMCLIKKSSKDVPGNDMKLCTGQLKEEMQEIIIDKMHNYILQNIGEIKEDLL